MAALSFDATYRVERKAVSHRAYRVQFSVGAKPWQELGTFPSTRHSIPSDTATGTVCSVRVQAVNGATQSGPWIRTVSIVSQ